MSGGQGGGRERPGRWHGKCRECGTPYVLPGTCHPDEMSQRELVRALLCAGCAGDAVPETREQWERRTGGWAPLLPLGGGEERRLSTVDGDGTEGGE